MRRLLGVLVALAALFTSFGTYSAAGGRHGFAEFVIALRRRGLGDGWPWLAATLVLITLAYALLQPPAKRQSDDDGG